MLSVTDLSVAYGAIQAVNGISFEIPRGAIVTLIGGNGACKTTTLQTISGLIRPRAGSIRFNGADITRLAPHEIVARGLCHVPEGRLVFANLSVAENLALGAYLQKDKAVIERTQEHIFTLFPRLKERFKQAAGTLSGGEQQMLAIGRALMGQPDLILLDEPSIGLAPKIFDQILSTVVEINRERKTTIVIAEQNVRKILKIVDFAYVLEAGKVAISGSADSLSSDESIRRAYLGL